MSNFFDLYLVTSVRQVEECPATQHKLRMFSSSFFIRHNTSTTRTSKYPQTNELDSTRILVLADILYFQYMYCPIILTTE